MLLWFHVPNGPRDADRFFVLLLHLIGVQSAKTSQVLLLLLLLLLLLALQTLRGMNILISMLRMLRGSNSAVRRICLKLVQEALDGIIGYRAAAGVV